MNGGETETTRGMTNTDLQLDAVQIREGFFPLISFLLLFSAN